MNRLGVALAALLGLAFVATRSSSSSAPPAAVAGLVPGSWYELVIISSLDSNTFGPDAAGQQAQGLLGVQGFDVRASTPSTIDPTSYTIDGIYRGTTGALSNVPGITIVQATPTTAIASNIGGPQFIDARPVPLTPGRTYYGRASISWPLSALITQSAIASKLTSAGFTGITVYTDAGDLPASWPSTQRAGNIFATATYAGTAPTIALPSQVVSVWT